jgi:hypothetical protein
VIATILTGLPLILLELGLLAVAATAFALVIRRTPPHVVREIMPVLRAGAIAGALATVIYDATRAVLSVLDPSPYNPFEAVRQFGLGILPAGSPVLALLAAGLAVHLVNGGSFGVIYAVVAGRRRLTLRAALATGIVWGLCLEIIQSILYPGWLGITTVLREFLLISSLGHVAYGSSLGLITRQLLAPSSNRRP